MGIKGLTALISEICLDAYNVFDCHDYARIEVRVDKLGNPYILEINPNPSINNGDCVPNCAEMTGQTDKIVANWAVPGGGSPDMGDVSANGKVLWLSGRYNSAVYALDTRTGRLIARIPVGASPHGLSVWPQPGRYSLGHTGNMR